MKTLNYRKLLRFLAPRRQVFFLITAPLFLSAFALAQPSLKLCRTAGPPTSTVEIIGQGFGANVPIEVFFDTTNLTKISTDATGAFSKIFVQIPASAAPGNHSISAVPANASTGPKQSFLVRTDWPQFGFNPNGARFNPYENVLNPSNVKSLVLDWTAATQPISEAIVAGGLAYTGSGPTLYGINAGTGAIVWSTFNTESPAYSSFVVFDNVLYSHTDNGNLWAVNAQTGAFVWDYPDGNTGWNPPTEGNGSIYVVTADGQTLSALKPAPGGLEWTYSFPVFPNSAPAVVNGVVYVGADQVYAINKNGTLLWTFTNSTAQKFRSPAVSSGVVYIGAFDNNLYALNASSGIQAWSAPVGGLNGSPAVDYQRVYVSSLDGHVYALNKKTGARLWSFNTGGIMYSSPAVANGVVYATSFANGTIYSLNATNGALLWKYATGGKIQGSPIVVNGILYTTNAGSLLAFHLKGTTAAAK